MAAPVRKAGSKKPVLLSGGNPQIAKGYGDAPVQAYIAAAPGWKSGALHAIDALIEKTVPGARKAVKWNSPFYGAASGAEDTWFLGLHIMTKYINVAFFTGAQLRPMPPGESRLEGVRYLRVHEDDFDEKQLSAWVKQASKLPGVKR